MGAAIGCPLGAAKQPRAASLMRARRGSASVSLRVFEAARADMKCLRSLRRSLRASSVGREPLRSAPREASNCFICLSRPAPRTDCPCLDCRPRQLRELRLGRLPADRQRRPALLRARRRGTLPRNEPLPTRPAVPRRGRAAGRVIADLRRLERLIPIPSRTAAAPPLVDEHAEDHGDGDLHPVRIDHREQPLDRLPQRFSERIDDQEARE